VLRDTFVLWRLDIKNQEDFHRQIFKHESVLGGCLYFSCGLATMHFTCVSCHISLVQNVNIW